MEGRSLPLFLLLRWKMIYAIITFVIGVVIGGGVAKRRARHYWQKRIKATRQDLFAQYTGDIQAETRQAEARQREAAERIRNRLEKQESSWLAKQEGWTEREQRLVDQLKAAQHSHQEQQDDYEALLKEQQSNYLKLQIEHNKHRDNVSAALQSSLEVEKKNTTLLYEIKSLKNKLESLEKRLDQSKQEHAIALSTTAQELDLNLNEIVKKLFPEVELVRDSLAQLNQHKSDFAAVLAEIQMFVHNGKPTRLMKVRATHGKWLECRAGKMGRIYYRKTKAHRYKVLVSWKKDEKSQKKDIAWLNQN